MSARSRPHLGKVDWKELIPPIAHDVRALVRKGLSNAQFLEKLIRPAADTEISAHLRAIIESQYDLNHLFVRLIALADADETQERSAHHPEDTIDLETAVLGAKLECRDAMQLAGGELVVGLLPSCAVPPKTQIVLKELLQNSLRYADPDRPPKIAIDANHDSQRVRVRVVDNGSGLPAAYTDKLFQPMQRLDASRSGFGLGLAIAKAIVEGAGGTIYFEPSNQGATFVFELPVADPAG
jgi:two-component system, chemotaxis family, sensor kinase Cph1